MQVNQYPLQATEITVLDRFGFDQQDTVTLDWQTKKFDLPTLVDGIVNMFPSLFDTIYTADGAIDSDRTVDLASQKLMFVNGRVYINTTGVTGGLFQMELVSATSGMIISSQNVGLSISANTGSGVVVNGSNIGFYIQAPRNIIQATGLLPAAEPSSIFDINSTTQGVRSTPIMTEVQRDAIISPAYYLEILNSTRERKEIYRPFWGWHPVGEITPDWGYVMRDECINTSPVDGFTQSVLNGGTRAARIDTTVNGSPVQLIGFSTGTTNNGESSHLLNGYFLGGTGKKKYETKVSVSTLSNVTERYFVVIGMYTTNAGINNADGMYFLYDEGGVCASATASPNWLCICKNGGAYSIVNSGIAVVDTTSPLHRLEILDYGTGNKVEFLINSTVVATITTNIPDSTKAMYVGERIMKTAGTTARLAYIDFSYMKEKFNTPR